MLLIGLFIAVGGSNPRTQLFRMRSRDCHRKWRKIQPITGTIPRVANHDLRIDQSPWTSRNHRELYCLPLATAKRWPAMPHSLLSPSICIPRLRVPSRLPDSGRLLCVCWNKLSNKLKWRNSLAHLLMLNQINWSSRDCPFFEPLSDDWVQGTNPI